MRKAQAVTKQEVEGPRAVESFARALYISLGGDENDFTTRGYGGGAPARSRAADADRPRYDAFGDIRAMFYIITELEWKTPIFSGIMVPKTPNASYRSRRPAPARHVRERIPGAGSRGL